MSIETFSPLPLNTFGSWVTLLDPSDVPIGMSPNLSDVDFFPGGIRTRPGLLSIFSGVGGTPNINGLKTYVTPSLTRRCLVYDSLGNLYKETTPGILSGVSGSGMTPGLFLTSATHFGREYMAFGDGVSGQDIPRQYDDTNLDRVSQIGPAEGPTVANSASGGNISPGTHQCVVVFVTRQGYWTAPSPASSWSASGNLKVDVTNIPTGPANVVQRLLAFTASGGANFYHVPATMALNDNSTTSLTVDFADTVLLSGVNVDYLFSQIELPEQLGVMEYAERLFWWGERAQMDNWRNLSFDGGWDGSGNGRPLGWQLDASFGAGAGRESANVVWGDAFSIIGDGSSIVRGMIEQSAAFDVNGNPLCVKNVAYSVRARVAHTGNLTQGTLRINAYSASAGQVGTGLSVSALQATSTYQEFTAELFGSQASIPTDLVLRVYGDTTLSPSGAAFFVENIEIFPTNGPLNGSIVRASGTAEPEAYDGVTGFMSIGESNGQSIRNAFTLRNNLYFVKERSMYVTATDGVNEPALWTIEEVSNEVGTPSPHGVGIGEDWVVIAGRSGLYLFDGSEPVKLSQEIQPTWDSLNWEHGQTLWVQVDTQHKKIYVGVPMGSATQPNRVLMLDYSEGFGDPLVAMLTAPERSRKWAPWTIAGNSCGLIERSDGTAQVLFGSNNGTGKVYQLSSVQYSDDGIAINSFFSTAFLAATGLGGRNLFGYLTAYVHGAGVLSVSSYSPAGDTDLTNLGSWTLSSPAARDMEQFTNVTAERVSFQAGTNAAGSWFSLTKFVPWVKPDPFALVRGTN